MLRLSLLGTLLLAAVLVAGGIPALPEAAAMGTRPPRVPAKQQEMNAPEIEIITMSDQARSEFSGEPQPQPQMTVAPKELLPPVKPSGNEPEKKSRITDIQTALKNAGFDPGPIDGKTGAKTKKAIRAFQRANHLVIDGVVGEKTWTQLKTYLSSPPANKQ